MTNSFSLNVTARLRFGLTMQGGFNYALTNANSCAIRAALPESDAVDPWCDVNTSLLRVTALGSYTVPKIDVLLATTFRSEQGQQLAANYTTGPANTTLGRPFAGVSQTITVNLIEPGTLYGDRANQLDLRVAKNLRFGGTRTNVGVDVFNILNSNPGGSTEKLIYSNTWFHVMAGSGYRLPTRLTARGSASASTTIQHKEPQCCSTSRKCTLPKRAPEMREARTRSSTRMFLA